MDQIIKKIVKELTVDEIDTLVKFIWLHNEKNIETVVNMFQEELRNKLIDESLEKIKIK